MKRCVITGSFDPVTSGHLDLISRASKMFDEVYAVIVFNAEKPVGAFSAEERLELLKSAVSEIKADNVRADSFSGLTSDYIRAVGAEFIVRGARNATDFDYEYNLSLIMKRFCPECETVILPAAPTLSAISSTYVRELLKYSCDLGDAVPEACKALAKEFYTKRYAK